MKTKPVVTHIDSTSPTKGKPAAAHGDTPGPEKRTPDRWKWHQRTLLALRQRLIGESTEHRQDSAQPKFTESLGFSDSVSDRNEREVLLAELEMEENMLAEIDAALLRLQLGTYGICEDTGQTIPADRLRALPWTRFTKEAAARREQAAR